MKGSRIHGIVRELKNENIDVINFTSNIQLLIQRSLTPAKISYMDLDNDKKHADVYLKADQVSLAIGRRGVNIKLACELTGYDIDVFRENEGEEEEEFDIDLEEFSDEIEPWIIDELKRVGCDTARSVLKLSPEETERRTDLEKETIMEIRRILKEEFEKG
jgi:transcription termination/antitermination protein NusA